MKSYEDWYYEFELMDKDLCIVCEVKPSCGYVCNDCRKAKTLAETCHDCSGTGNDYSTVGEPWTCTECHGSGVDTDKLRKKLNIHFDYRYQRRD